MSFFTIVRSMTSPVLALQNHTVEQLELEGARRQLATLETLKEAELKRLATFERFAVTAITDWDLPRRWMEGHAMWKSDPNAVGGMMSAPQPLPQSVAFHVSRTVQPLDPEDQPASVSVAGIQKNHERESVDSVGSQSASGISDVAESNIAPWNTVPVTASALDLRPEARTPGSLLHFDMQFLAQGGTTATMEMLPCCRYVIDLFPRTLLRAADGEVDEVDGFEANVRSALEQMSMLALIEEQEMRTIDRIQGRSGGIAGKPDPIIAAHRDPQPRQGAQATPAVSVVADDTHAMVPKDQALWPAPRPGVKKTAPLPLVNRTVSGGLQVELVATHDASTQVCESRPDQIHADNEVSPNERAMSSLRRRVPEDSPWRRWLPSAAGSVEDADEACTLGAVIDVLLQQCVDAESSNELLLKRLSASQHDNTRLHLDLQEAKTQNQLRRMDHDSKVKEENPDGIVHQLHAQEEVQRRTEAERDAEELRQELEQNRRSHKKEMERVSAKAKALDEALKLAQEACTLAQQRRPDESNAGRMVVEVHKEEEKEEDNQQPTRILQMEIESRDEKIVDLQEELRFLRSQNISSAKLHSTNEGSSGQQNRTVSTGVPSYARATLSSRSPKRTAGSGVPPLPEDIDPKTGEVYGEEMSPRVRAPTPTARPGKTDWVSRF